MQNGQIGKDCLFSSCSLCSNGDLPYKSTRERGLENRSLESVISSKYPVAAFRKGGKLNVPKCPSISSGLYLERCHGIGMAISFKVFLALLEDT